MTLVRRKPSRSHHCYYFVCPPTVADRNRHAQCRIQRVENLSLLRNDRGIGQDVFSCAREELPPRSSSLANRLFSYHFVRHTLWWDANNARTNLHPLVRREFKIARHLNLRPCGQPVEHGACPCKECGLEVLGGSQTRPTCKTCNYYVTSQPVPHHALADCVALLNMQGVIAGVVSFLEPQSVLSYALACRAAEDVLRQVSHQ